MCTNTNTALHHHHASATVYRPHDACLSQLSPKRCVSLPPTEPPWPRHALFWPWRWWWRPRCRPSWGSPAWSSRRRRGSWRPCAERRRPTGSLKGRPARGRSSEPAAQEHNMTWHDTTWHNTTQHDIHTMIDRMLQEGQLHEYKCIFVQNPAVEAVHASKASIIAVAGEQPARVHFLISSAWLYYII